MAKKTITITLNKNELLYDIENKAWLTGRSREDGTNDAVVSKMQAGDEDADRNQMLRCISNAVATLRNNVAEWLGDAYVYSANDTLMTDSTAYTIVLQMPMNYNTSVNDAVVAAMHQYVVNSALAEWFNMTAKEETQDYYTLAAANLEQLKTAMYKRNRPARPIGDTVNGDPSSNPGDPQNGGENGGEQPQGDPVNP